MSLSKLRLFENSVCYDIGAGTGSVAIRKWRWLIKEKYMPLKKKKNWQWAFKKKKQKRAVSRIIWRFIEGLAPGSNESFRSAYPCLYRGLFRKYEGNYGTYHPEKNSRFA